MLSVDLQKKTKNKPACEYSKDAQLFLKSIKYDSSYLRSQTNILKSRMAILSVLYGTMNFIKYFFCPIAFPLADVYYLETHVI